MGDVVSLQAKKEKEITEADPKLTAALIELREWVDNANQRPAIALAGQTYQARNLDPKVHSILWQGMEIGCRLLAGPEEHLMVREVFVHFPQPIKSIPAAEKDPIMLAIFEALLMEGQGEVELGTFRFGHREDRKEKRHDAVRVAQEFSIILLERSGGPGAVSFDESVLKDILDK